jgi:hypothetical protein
MFQWVIKTIVGKLAFDGVTRTTHTISFRVSSLDHKATDNSVKNQAVIKTSFYKGNKVVNRIGSDLRI